MTTENGNGAKKPLAVYAVIDRKEAGKPSIWLRVGAAFPNRDGSLTLLLDAFPATTNRLQVREQRFPDERPGRSAPAEEPRP